VSRSPLRPADLLREDWLRWVKALGVEDDEDASDDQTTVERELAWPTPGRELVLPYIVDAIILRSPEVSTFNLRLYVEDRRGFQHDGDHLWAAVSPGAPRHLRLNDLLVRGPRSRGRGTILLSGLEMLCGRRGFTWIEGGISRVDDMERLERFYRHRGYTVIKNLAKQPFEWSILKEL
jgi:GNAT superfamily N-acetyltransferase